MKFKKKPVIIDAIQWDGENTFDVYAFVHGVKPVLDTDIAMMKWEEYCMYAQKFGLTIYTLEDGFDSRAKHVASIGDWIIKGVKGEFYPCKPDIFDLTYEPCSE